MGAIVERYEGRDVGLVTCGRLQDALAREDVPDREAVAERGGEEAFPERRKSPHAVDVHPLLVSVLVRARQHPQHRARFALPDDDRSCANRFEWRKESRIEKRNIGKVVGGSKNTVQGGGGEHLSISYGQQDKTPDGLAVRAQRPLVRVLLQIVDDCTRHSPSDLLSESLQKKKAAYRWCWRWRP